MASCIASGKYYFDTIYFGKSLKEWVELVHAKVCELNDWKVTELPSGSYGYNNFASSIGYLLNQIDTNKNILDYANLVYKGWCENYIYWRDNEPYLLENTQYIKPFKPINDANRNLLAITKFNELPEYEQKKDIEIETIVLSLLNIE